MRQTVERLMRQHGTGMTLHTAGGAVAFRGFLHAVNAKSAQRGKRALTVLGETPAGAYLLILPAELKGVPGDRVAQGQRHFEIRSLEPVLYGDIVLYQCGMCAEVDA